MFNFDHRNKDSYTDMENIIQNVYFMAHPVYTASQVMKILLAAERVKFNKVFLTREFLGGVQVDSFLGRSTVHHPTPCFPIERTCFQREQQVLTIEILRHTTNSRARSRENQATLTVSSPIAAPTVPRFQDFHSIDDQQVHAHVCRYTRTWYTYKRARVRFQSRTKNDRVVFGRTAKAFRGIFLLSEQCV